MTKADYTHISILLDRSGSMQSCKDATISGVNEFLSKQLAVPGQASATLAQFDDQYEIIQSGKPLPETKELTGETYQPRGMTALYDSIARLIKDTGAYLSAMVEADRPAHVVFAIVTDGMENASSDFGIGTGGASKLRDMIQLQTKTYGWTFAYIGANQDAILSAQSIGIMAANAINYTASPVGTTKAYAAISDATAQLRCSRGATAAAFFAGKTTADETTT